MNGQTTHFTWDDEDRLTGQSFPDGHTDAYAYNGLGMRLTKSDPTGSYSYFTDGAAPASDVLSDGHTSFTPGLSETNALGSRFYLPDAQGNSRGLLDASQTATDGYNWDAFGSSVSRFGSDPTAFAWNEESGYQSDGDSGLKLLGHRYYDSRTGRFISQDPAGDGDNWYAYCDNDPMDEADPDGLKMWSVNGGDQTDANSVVDNIEGDAFSALSTRAQTVQLYLLGGHHTGSGNVQWDWAEPLSSWMIPGGMGGSTMFAQTMSESTDPPGQVLIHQMAEDGVGVGKPGNPLKLAKEDVSSIRSHVKQIEDHIDKMERYKRDPYSMDNQNTLTNPNNAQHLEKIIQGRINVLENTIQKHFGEIIKILNRQL